VVTSASYLLCGTPRTGSTLLCSLLSSTKVLGHPESYFREPDEAGWARQFGLESAGPRVRDYTAFAQAARAAGTTDNGIFGARVMWGSLERMMDGLGRASDRPDLATLNETFGPLVFFHLEREDIVGQAVSWCRAEQTGVWQHGDVASAPPGRDLDQLKRFVRTIRDHNAAWRAWFDRNGVRPRTVTYERIVQAPRTTVVGMAAELDVDVPPQWQPTSPHHRQADEINARWAAALQAALDENG
jgi:trehalose 2-sulfotransferase